MLKVSQPETLVISYFLVVTSCPMSALLLDVLDFPYVADQKLKNYNNNVKEKKTFSIESKVKVGSWLLENQFFSHFRAKFVTFRKLLTRKAKHIFAKNVNQLFSVQN